MDVTGVQVSPTAQAAAPIENMDEADPMYILELGDRVLIDSAKYGRTVGRIYYRDGDLIRIMPDGASNTLQDFPRIYTDEEDRFDDDLGVTQAMILDKRRTESFVEQQNFQVGQVLSAISADGEKLDTIMTVKSIDTEADSIVVDDQTGAESVIEFGFVGIPLEENFVILRITEQPREDQGEEGAMAAAMAEAAVVAEAAQLPAAEADDEEAAAAAATRESQEEEFEPEIVGYVTVLKTDVYREAAAAEKTYTDSAQKADALNDFVSMLDPVAQKNPKAIRAVRVLVESIFNLKQDTVEYNYDGTVRGERQTAVNMLSELLQSTHVPLSRPVLNAVLRVYTTAADEGVEEAALEGTDEQIEFTPFEEELVAMIKHVSPVVSGEGANKFRITQQAFFNDFDQPWRAGSKEKPLFTANIDTDFFREEIPDLGEKEEEGRVMTELKGRTASSVNAFDTLPYSIKRALTTTWYKAGSGPAAKKTPLTPADEATLRAYLLFPMAAAAILGSTRSGELAIDSARSKQPLLLMNEIIAALGSPTDNASPNEILVLGVTGETLGNIDIKDYLEGVSLPGLGMGDFNEALTQLGLIDFEVTGGMMAVLEEKMTTYQNQLRVTLSQLREALAGAVPVTPEENPLLPEVPVLREVIGSEPILIRAVQKFESLNPTLKGSDVALTAYLLTHYTDYFQAAMGQQAYYVAVERNRATRDMFIEALRISRILEIRRSEKGLAPAKNPCPHVTQEREIRKIRDDEERFQLLAKFLTKFQGERDENFINCNACHKHLLCVHERLQIQGFLNPRENPNIQKEILLNFSGGQFQGNFICRSCGQPISEIPFDSHIEYDDEGRAMMGRSVLVDTDSIFQKQLTDALAPNLETPEAKKRETGEADPYEPLIKQLAARAGIAMMSSAIKRITSRVQQAISNVTPALLKALKSAKKIPPNMDYDVWSSRKAAAAIAVFTLIEAQTAIPSVEIVYPLQGCNATLEGYPLGQPSDQRAVTYIACCLATLKDNVVWENAGFYRLKDATKRIQMIVGEMLPILDAAMTSNMIVQEDIRIKREYLLETSGREAAEGRHFDRIPTGFLPEMIVASAAEAAEGPIVEEVAERMGRRGQQALAELWIRKAHGLAKRTASLIHGSPFSVTTCCLGNISAPGAFWQASKSLLPPIDGRSLRPDFRSTALQVHFVPRPMSEIHVESSDEFNYRLFLKFCYDGPRRGYQHEFGVTNKCYWCDLQLPFHPAVIDMGREGKEALEKERMAGLEAQRRGALGVVDTGAAAFEQLLDEVHLKNLVQPYKAHKAPRYDAVLGEFASLPIEPVTGWNGIIQRMSDAFAALPPGYKRDDVLGVLAEISDTAAKYESEVKARFKSDYHNILSMFMESNWDNWLQAMNAYFLVPFGRIARDFSIDTLKVPPEYKLGEGHEGDIDKIMARDTELLKEFGSEVKQAWGFYARDRLRAYTDQMAGIVGFKQRLRPVVVPGRDDTLYYIKKLAFYGSLSELFDKSVLPRTTRLNMNFDTMPKIGDNSVKMLLKLVLGTLLKYKKEHLAYSDEELRDILAIRVEKERAEVFGQFDTLDGEERVMEVLKKNLGIGRWAVGGTKKIWGYDAEQYEVEREERARAGIIDYPVDEAMNLEGGIVPATDFYGFAAEEAEDVNDGYDFAEADGED